MYYSWCEFWLLSRMVGREQLHARPAPSIIFRIWASSTFTKRRDDRFPLIIGRAKFSGLLEKGKISRFFFDQNGCKTPLRENNNLSGFQVSILVHNLAGGLRLTLDALARRMRTNCMPECLTMWRKILRNFPKISHEPAYTRRGISLTTSKGTNWGLNR